ncbi:MAG: hypothetical protein FJ280_03095 [Planctomycetes bacterium]|nr:hypothetical protein [Planctomycetota bacterium]
MVVRAQHTQSVIPAATLCDFTIEGAAELGECAGACSFRATRRCDGQPVLLHKFRPAQTLVDLGPLVAGGEPPDFTKPFVTRFTDLFVVAGSAYLVEPLPPCVALSDLWRCVLQKRPDQALTVLAVAVRHIMSVLGRLAAQNRIHGGLSAETIVLAPTAHFGVLAAHLPCREGRLWLRRDPESPVRPDFAAFAEVLGVLLDIEAQTATLQNLPLILPAPVRRSIQELSHVVERARARVDRC